MGFASVLLLMLHYMLVCNSSHSPTHTAVYEGHTMICARQSARQWLSVQMYCLQCVISRLRNACAWCLAEANHNSKSHTSDCILMRLVSDVGIMSRIIALPVFTARWRVTTVQGPRRSLPMLMPFAVARSTAATSVQKELLQVSSRWVPVVRPRLCWSSLLSMLQVCRPN